MIYEVTEEEPWLVEEGQRDLRERTKEFALRIIRMFSALPKSTESQVLGKQVLRSGTSVGANYREAFRARSKPDGARQRGDGGSHAARVKRGEHLRVPAGRKCEQTAYWLELLTESQIVSPFRLERLCDECNQLTAIFTTIAKNSKASPPQNA